MTVFIKHYYLFIFFAFAFLSGIVELRAEGCQIELRLSNYRFKEVYLATFEGGKPHYRDTASMRTDSFFLFKSTEPLAEGIYLLLLKPRMQALQLLINKDEQHFKLSANAADLNPEQVQVQNSPANSRYYEYLRYTRAKRKAFNELFKEQEKTKGKEFKKYQKKLDRITKEIYDHQEKLIRQHPGSLLELLLRLDHEPLQPDWQGNQEEQRQKGLQFRQQHFFDGVPMNDPRIVQSPLFYNKVNFYLEKLFAQEPDSVMHSIQKVLQLTEPGGPNYTALLEYLLGKYEHPRIAGQDAVFVKLVDQYLATIEAAGISQDDRKDWLRAAEKLRPVLIGQTAPDVVMQQRNGKAFRLHQIEAHYTVLIFWRPNCGHCKKATPVLKELFEKYKDSNDVKLVGLCTQHGDGLGKCWDYVDEHQLEWLQLADRYHRSRFMQKYNAQRTPKIYILDKDKKILMKDIGAEHIDKVLQKFRKS